MNKPGNYPVVPLFVKKTVILILFAIIIFTVIRGFSFFGDKKVDRKKDSLSGDLIIFHAGSLAVPVKEICDSFIKIYPDVNILTEAAGSKACARKISDLKRRCDVFASADIEVIKNMLIPRWAKWAVPFAGNEMAIVYHNNSKYSQIINSKNWYRILSRSDVKTGRSDPASDPCGVRAEMTAKLSEKYYNLPGLSDNLLGKDLKYIRPKETDLLALLETGSIDYIYLYKSVAIQHKLNYIDLPDEINLKNRNNDSLYHTVYVETPGKGKGEIIREYGSAITYGITIPSTCGNYDAAATFVKFVLSEKGKDILKRNGQI